jgi:predicted anti-sigma-YlaC factor YlaD
MFCWFFRLRISHAADVDKSLSLLTKRHVNNCTCCREFYNLCQWLGEDLPREAAGMRDKIPTSLSKRILEGVGSGKPKTYRVRSKLRPVAAAACIALIIAAGVLLVARRRPNRSAEETEQPAARLVNLVGQDPSGTAAELLEEPLATEWQNIVEDTESAVRFLLACVPVDITDTEADR